MSAYQVTSKCLYEVMNLINKVYGSGEHYKENQKIKETCINNPELFFNQLSKLNNLSLVERYPDLKDKPEGMIIPLKYNEQEFLKVKTDNDFMQWYKSGQSYTYQSCEGEAGNSQLYRSIDFMVHEMSGVIVSNLKTYETARWS
jgi:hypothetical protein